jgi:hypothetical protein
MQGLMRLKHDNLISRHSYLIRHCGWKLTLRTTLRTTLCRNSTSGSRAPLHAFPYRTMNTLLVIDMLGSCKLMQRGFDLYQPINSCCKLMDQ